jgi:hypothetical protein
LVFVTEVGCVFCEVQAQAKETVEHQASVMIHCNSVAKIWRNLSVCVQISSVVLDSVYQFNVQGKQHSESLRSVTLWGHFVTCLNKLCAFLLGLFHLWRAKFAALYFLL